MCISAQYTRKEISMDYTVVIKKIQASRLLSIRVNTCSGKLILNTHY